MIIAIKKELNRSKVWLVPLIFLILSFISVIYLWHFGYVYHNGDYIYHFARVNAIKYSLIHHRFPLVNIGGTIPYGTTLSYYPWLTLLPIVGLSFLIHNGVDLFYITIFLSTLLTYFIAYYSSHTYDKSYWHNFVFALFYTSSSVIFDFSFREGDIGSLLAVIFIPLAFFGLLRLIKFNKGWLMLSIGMILTAGSHVITGTFTGVALLIIALLNIKSFKFTGILKAILSLIIFLCITSIFWYPDLILTTHNNLVMPTVPATITSGIIPYFDSSCNFVYGLIDLVGLVSIFWCCSKRYKWFDFICWIIGFLCILINIDFIGNKLTSIVPALLHIQMSYRFALVGHMFLAFIGTKLLLGMYVQKHYYRLPLIIFFVLIIGTPLTDEMTFHFLMHNRPVFTTQLNNKNGHSNKLIQEHKLGHTAWVNRDMQFKWNAKSFKTFKHYYYCYDYAPSKSIIELNYFDRHYQAQTFDNRNQWSGVIRYHAKDNGIEFYSKESNHNVQLPIVIYKGLKYRFTINDAPLPESDINQKLTHKSNELVLNHNIPHGKETVSISNVMLN